VVSRAARRRGAVIRSTIAAYPRRLPRPAEPTPERVEPPRPPHLNDARDNQRPAGSDRRPPTLVPYPPGRSFYCPVLAQPASTPPDFPLHRPGASRRHPRPENGRFRWPRLYCRSRAAGSYCPEISETGPNRRGPTPGWETRSHPRSAPGDGAREAMYGQVWAGIQQNGFTPQAACASVPP
jgi:hypothetical protein